MNARKPWIGTSWKMNKTRIEALAFARELKGASPVDLARVHAFVMPPFPYIADVAEVLRGTSVRVGAQNMHWADHGAWTGEISAPMLRDCGASLVEIGHSERRQHFGETDETVALKTAAALRHGLTALVCIGDSRAEYESGETAKVLARQVRALLKHVGKDALGHVLIAYEPVWSIGVGGVPATPEFANEQHVGIAEMVAALTGGHLPILYGGSVNATNCAALVSQHQIDGLFIGRAASDARNYLAIMQRAVGAL